MTRRGCMIVTGALLACIAFGTYAYIGHAYFFNPFTFQQDDVTYLPWSWYTSPMQVEYLVHGLPQRFLIVTDEDEVRTLFRLLKEDAATTPRDSWTNPPDAPQGWGVAIRTESEGIILQADGFVGVDDVVVLSLNDRQVLVHLSDELRKLVQQRLNQAPIYP